MSVSTDLELAVFRTICWFSVFEIPLSRFEIWKWLLSPARPYDLFEVDQVLEGSQWLSCRVNEYQGFWSLKNLSHAQIHQRRHEKFLDASRKFQKLHRISPFFASIPAVQAIAAANTLAWWHTGSASDIDLYIITQPHRIWSSRFFLVLPFLIAGHRPHQSLSESGKDPFCFSFFSTSDALQLEELKWNDQDYYLAYWIKSLVPILDREKQFAYMNTLNKWADSLLPNAHVRRIHPFHQPRWSLRLPIQWSLFEPFFRWLQRYRFPLVLRELANKDTRVVIRDDMLKFHENDRRQDFMQRFQDTYERNL